MIKTEIKSHDDFKKVSVPQDFFSQIEQIHQDFDTAQSAKELVNAAIKHASEEPSAVNAAVATSFVARCSLQIECSRMSLDEFGKLDELSEIWDKAPKAKPFFQAVCSQLLGVAEHDDKLLADVAILMILKEQFPTLTFCDAVTAFTHQ